jgi:hypothetical protein
MLCACARRKARQVSPEREPAEACLEQQLLHRRRRNRETEAVQLADDSLVAPTRVLPRQPNNQLTDLDADWRPADPTRVRPAVRDQTAVPAQQCRRRNEE